MKMPKVEQSLHRFDLNYLQGSRNICGVDEAGRGPLAGPVSAGAVLLNEDFYTLAKQGFEDFPINDSKKLNEKQREICFDKIKCWQKEGLIIFSNVMLGVAEIEEHNILGATSRAMEACIEEVEKESALTFSKLTLDGEGDVAILIDGRPVKRLSYQHEGIIKGDGKSLAIAMASIVAKVSRDIHMMELHENYPQYGFDVHKGYGTKTHREAILKHGPCPEHRPTFLRKLLGEEEQATMDLA